MKDCTNCLHREVPLYEHPCGTCFVFRHGWLSWEPLSKAQTMIDHITASKWMLGNSTA